MIRLGLDFYGTIEKDPKVYKRLAEAILTGGGEVHILTAVAPENARRAEKDVRHSRVPHTQLHIIPSDDYLLVPQLKASKAALLHLDVMIDDRRDICEFLRLHRILALQAL